MIISSYLYDLWYAQALLTATVVLLMWRKRLLHEIPCFTLYLFFELISFPINFVLIHGKYRYYFWGASLLELGSMVLVLLTLKQLYLRAMQDFAGFRAFGDAAFKLGTVAMAVSAVAASLLIGFQERSAVMIFRFTLEEILYTVTIGFVILLTLTARYLGVRFGGLLFGIALGFGLEAGLNLLSVSIRHSFNFAAGSWIQVMIPLSSAAVTRVIWVAYVLLPKRADHRVPIASTQLSSWNMALSELMSLDPTPADRNPVLR